MGLANFEFLPSEPQMFWGFLPFLHLTVNTAKIPLGVLYLYLVTLGKVGPYPRSRRLGRGQEDPELAIITVHFNFTMNDSKGSVVTKSNYYSRS